MLIPGLILYPGMFIPRMYPRSSNIDTGVNLISGLIYTRVWVDMIPGYVHPEYVQYKTHRFNTCILFGKVPQDTPFVPSGEKAAGNGQRKR